MVTVRAAAHEVLVAHGITRVFGNPGSNELPFLRDLPRSIAYVLGLHEGVVVGMADGWSQVTGRPGFCNLHSGSGTGNAMGALLNARYSRTPLVITAGQQVRGVIGLEGMLANVDAASLPKPLVDWSAEPAHAQDVPRALAQAIHVAVGRRTPTYLSVPYDDWDQDAGENGHHAARRTVTIGRAPTTDQIETLARRVRRAERPALVLGPDIDAAGLNDRAVTLAERMGCPVWVSPSPFRLPFPNRHAQFRGVLPAGVEPIAAALARHDLVLVLGAPVFRYHQNLPGRLLGDETTLVQITDDFDAAARAPMGEALVADLEAVLTGLLDGLPDPAGTRGRGVSAYRPPDGPERAGVGVHPEEVFATLRRSMPADTAYVVESTSTTTAFWNQMDLRHPGSYFFPASGGLGFGLPATIGAALGHRDRNTGRHVVGVIGDGSANYAIPALWSAVDLGVDADIVILRNGTYGALRWFAELLDVGEVPGLDLPGVDLTQIASGYGLPATHVPDAAALDDLLAAPRPDGPRLIQIDTALTRP